MTAVIREIDALPYTGLAPGPLHLHAADEPRNSRQQAGDGVDAFIHKSIAASSKFCLATRKGKTHFAIPNGVGGMTY
jgi:hypothetical protein